jgi:hypothetical protein
MSKSYKYPVYKDHSYSNDGKRYSNKSIRRYLNKLIIGFKGYKFIHKIFDKYNISDYRWYPKDINDILKAKRK